MIYKLFYYLYKKLKHEYGIDLLPYWFRNWVTTALKKVATLGAKKYPPPEKTVLDYDWNYLIIIDACRHDLFEEVYGETDFHISIASCTTEWFDKLFEDGRHYEDLIYITANPKISQRKKKNDVSFFEHKPVWDYGWDDDLEATPPNETTKKALELAKEHPNKKMIIHYMKPHFPFIGEHKITRPVLRNLDWARGEIPEDESLDVWDTLGIGKLTEEEVWRAYKENLKLVMGEVEKLKKELDGKIILTSDHGNCKGEHGIYGHPRGYRIEELVKVPLMVYG